jgi:uncharacterized membrane protein
MNVIIENLVLVVGGVLTALHAGLLYDFSVDIVPALRSIKGSAHISMMQAINTKIENPVFFLSFFGPIVLLPLATILHWGKPQFSWLLAASIIQIFGCEGVTVLEYPLNNKPRENRASNLAIETSRQDKKTFRAGRHGCAPHHSHSGCHCCDDNCFCRLPLKAGALSINLLNFILDTKRRINYIA